MYFAYGSSRYVLCIGNIAIKVARFDQLFRHIFRYFYWQKNGGAMRRIVGTYGSPLFLLTQILFGGILSNLEERDFYKRNKELPVAPTFFSLFGLVNIQARGKRLRNKDLTVCPFREYAHLEVDLRKPEHFGQIDGRICLLDYGHVGVNNLIAPRCSHWARA